MFSMRNLEMRLEKLVEGAFGKLFPANAHPVEIAKAVLRTMDRDAVKGVRETLAPNKYIIKISGVDYERLSGIIGKVTDEIVNAVIERSTERGYTLTAKPSVDFEKSRVRKGEVFVEASFSALMGDGNRAMVSERPASQGICILFTNGGRAGDKVFPSTVPFMLGRAADCEIKVPDPMASRRHALIERRGSSFWVQDLESKNGTYVFNEAVIEKRLNDSDEIRVGSTVMKIHLE